MRIGLTGSIACGKTTAADYLRSLGIPVVDADAISRSLTAPGGAALPLIRNAFGDSVFQGEALDRAALGTLVFRNPEKRELLNSILHPMILSETENALRKAEADHQLVFGDIPLLFECGLQDRFDENWVVSASPEVQLIRLMERDHLTEEQALLRIASQMPTEEKEKLADRVIHSDGSMEETRQQVDALLYEINNRRTS